MQPTLQTQGGRLSCHVADGCAADNLEVDGLKARSELQTKNKHTSSMQLPTLRRRAPAGLAHNATCSTLKCNMRKFNSTASDFVELDDRCATSVSPAVPPAE
jgi:hypothetical protein